MLYEIVKEAADSKDISIQRVEKDLGLSNGTIGKWRTQAPRWDTVFRVAKYLKIPLSKLREVADNVPVQ